MQAASAPLPPALVAAAKAGVTVERTFPAVSGMTGYVINRQGDFSIVYSTPDGQSVVNGIVIGPDGRNMSNIYEDQYIPKPDMDGMWATLEKASVITTGATGASVKKVVYAFFDPNCPYCHLVWLEFAPYAAEGLQVRWVPVAFEDATSDAKAAAIMQAADPAGTLALQERTFHQGGLDARGVTISAATKDKLAANIKLMGQMGFNGTPAIVYKDAKTNKVVTRNGLPKVSVLPGLLNLPPLPNNDPELAQFQ